MARVEIRPYRGGDEEGIVSAWNAALVYDPIDMDRFVRTVLCDANFQPEGLQVAVSGGEIVGFALAIERRVPLFGADLEPQRGWITAWGVRPERQGEGIGRALLAAAEAFLASRGKERVAVSPYAPNYVWPGVDREAYPRAYALLEAAGYRTLYVAAAMDRSLVGFAYPEDVRRLEEERRREGYAFRPLGPALLAELVAFAHQVFSPDWGRAVREAVVQGAAWDQILVATAPTGRVVGFAMYGGYGGILERFGPFGVDPNERGKGLGKILLYKAMTAMASRGLHGVWFLWTGETTPAGSLYLRAGFQVTRRFHVMERRLESFSE